MGNADHIRSVVSLTIAVYSTLTCSLGLLLIFSGFLLRSSGLDLFNDLLSDAVKYFMLKVDTIPKQLPCNYHEGFGKLTYDIEVLTKSISIILVCFGGFLILTVIVACVVGQMKRDCLRLYTIHLIFTTLALIVAFMMCQRIIQMDMLQSLKDYKGLGDQSEAGFTWTALMVGQQCCGVDSYRDFQHLDNWPPADLDGINASWMKSESFKTPIACCKDFGDVVQGGCHLEANASVTNNNMNNGCAKKIVSYFSHQEGVYAFFVAVLTFLISFCVVLIVRLVIGDKMKYSHGATPLSMSDTTAESAGEGEAVKEEEEGDSEMSRAPKSSTSV